MNSTARADGPTGLYFDAHALFTLEDACRRGVEKGRRIVVKREEEEGWRSDLAIVEVGKTLMISFSCCTSSLKRLS